jgi:4-aminobutyrate aminotransferase-like enzyme
MSGIIEKRRQYTTAGPVMFYSGDPMVLVEGRGATLIDSQGREYLDLFSAHAVASYGHCHPNIVNAIQKQAGQLMHYTSDHYTVPMSMLAEKLANMNNLGLSKTFFVNSGTEAVECALSLARKYTKRHEIISLWGGFHGRTFGSKSATGWSGWKQGMGPYMAGFSHVPSYYCYRCPFGLEYPSCGVACASYVKKAIKYQTSEDVAAFIAEPIQGTAGNIVAPDEYFKVLKEILDESDILLISDEVITGLGRSGLMFGIEHYNVRPDIITLGKALSGALPIGAMMASGEVGSSFEPGDYFSTFGGNPIASAASLAALETLEQERLVDRSRELGEYALKQFREMEDRHELIGDVRGKGLLIGIELVTDRKSKEPATKEAMRVRYEAKKSGVILASGMGWLANCIRFNPPLTISKDEIDRGLNVIDECLTTVEAGK